MGLPHRRCVNCRHFVYGSPREWDFWPTQHGHCYRRLHEDQGVPPYPTHANSRGCEKYEEKETCGTCIKFIPKHTGNGGVVYGMCPIGLFGKSTTSQMAGCSDWDGQEYPICDGDAIAVDLARLAEERDRYRTALTTEISMINAGATRRWCTRIGRGLGKQHALSSIDTSERIVRYITACGKEERGEGPSQGVFLGVVTCKVCLAIINDGINEKKL